MFRFAPSPTGDMHIEDLRVALINFMMAQQSKESFIVRIEDIDMQRNIPGKDVEILDILGTFGVSWDHLYYQSNNLKFHQQIGLDLLQKKKAFSCFCSPETLEKSREVAKETNKPYRYDNACENLPPEAVIDNENPFVVRLKKPEEDVVFTDSIKGEIKTHAEEVDSFVIMGTDKTATYDFACAVDDMLHDVHYVIRGDEHVSHTPKQIWIRQSLGYEKEIAYAHVPVILNTAGKKMSKSDDASRVKWLLEEGFLPQAITNYLLLLGNEVPQEIFTLDEAIKWFDISHISTSPVTFDMDKLRHINSEHIKITDPVMLASFIGYKSVEMGELAKLYTQEGSTLNEIKPKVDAIFAKKQIAGEHEESLTLLQECIKSMPYHGTFDSFTKEAMQVSGLKGKHFFDTLRILLSGAESGPDMGDLYPHIRNYIQEIIR